MYCRYLKAVFDRVLAIVLLLLLSPLIVITAAVVYFALGKPIFFKQIRAGKDGRLFTIYKFRTMIDARDNKGELLSDEDRLNDIGKFIRSTSLDELPQIFNILKGDMSFVGPRPLLAEYLKLYNDRQKRRHEVKPGITGWAQINGRNAISWQKKFDLDVWYVDNCSFWLDMKIFYKTFFKLVKRSDISSSNHVTTEKFRGNE
jgi:lipopolysaccharide/colanic/teichoic acid biosynthesis glycosyltransferase